MRPQVGQTLISATDTTTVIVVRAPARELVLTCGGVEMLDGSDSSAAQKVEALAGHTNGSLLGKRYEDVDATLEVLCTKGGPSSLALEDVPMAIKAAKPLPASD